MPPPRPEDVDESSDSSGSEDSDATPTPAPQPAAPVTVAAASARAAALAEQLAAQLAVTTASPASPAPRPKERPAAKEATELEPLILEAEAQDLVVIGNANCGAWIGKAIAESQFVAVVKTPVAPSTSVIVDARVAEEAQIKPEVLQRRWMAFRVRRLTGDPRLPLRELSALCDQLVQAGVEPRTLVPIDSRSYLLMSREHVQVSVTALVQCGHMVSPARRVVSAIPIPDTPTEVPDWQVGAWKLLQRHSAGTTKDCQKGDLFQCTLRIQAKCGIYCEVRSLERHEVTSDFHTQLSSYGMLRMDQSGARAWREPRVDFQVSKGSPTPFLRFTEGEDGSTLKEETLSTQGEMETWSKLLNAVGGSIGSISALELDSEDLAGLWIFAGNIFLRIIGVPKSQSLLGSHCCRSLTQLEHFQSQDAVQNELRKFEVLVGEVEQPGLLRARRSTWEGAGRLLLDAQPAEAGGPTAGAVELQLEDGVVIHQEPDGKQLRWRVKEWTFDPFTVPAPEIPSEPEAASESESVSESVRKKQQKDAKAASKGAAPKAKAKAKAQAAQAASPKKEEKETDDEKEEKEVKKKKHKKNKEEDRERKRAVSESRSSSEVKRKKKKDKSRGRSERKDKKDKEREKRKKKKSQRSPSRSRSKSRSKRRKKNRRSRSRRKASASRKSSHSEGKKEEKKSTKEKHIQERRGSPVPEELPEREIRLRRFAEQSKLIPQAMEALRNLKADLQDKIMEEGPIKEGDGNPIIVLMNRIKEVAEWAQQEAERSEDKAPGTAPAEPAENAQAPETTPEVTKANGHAEVPDSMLVRAFYLQNQLPEEALETLKALPGEVLMNVLMRGPLEASENPMLALQKRIEEAR